MSNSTPEQLFEYKAFNSDQQIVTGQEYANNFPHLAFTLRQKGLQVLEATTISADQGAANNALNKMKKRVAPPPIDKNNDKPDRSIRSMIGALIHLLRRG